MIICSRSRFGRWWIVFAAMILMLSTGPASSDGFDALDVEIQPSVPTAGEPFAVVVRAFACHVFLGEGPLDRVVEVAGSTVRVTVEYLPPPFNGSTCMPPAIAWSWSVGPMAAGSRTLVIVGEEPGVGGSPVELGQIPLTILAPVAAKSNVVPVNRGWALLLLGLSLAAWVMPALRVRR